MARKEGRKEDILYIRCNKPTITRFKIWVAMSGSKDYDEALNKLLDMASVPKRDIKSI